MFARNVMLRNTLLITVGLLIISISLGIALTSNHKVLEYSIDKENFKIVVVDDGMGYQKAKNIAMKRAAQTAKERGYNYFKVISEDKIRLIEGKQDWPSPYDFPQNLYQEDIVEKGFNRERFYHQKSIRPNAEATDGYEFDFQCSKVSIESYKVCDYTSC